jgi:hypothetical protein
MSPQDDRNQLEDGASVSLKEDASGQNVSAAELWAMKRESQRRDRHLLSSGAVAPRDMLLIRPEMLDGAQIEWPKDSLNEE